MFLRGLEHAMLPTTLHAPKRNLVEPTGFEPVFYPCEGYVRPLDDGPENYPLQTDYSRWLPAGHSASASCMPSLQQIVGGADRI